MTLLPTLFRRLANPYLSRNQRAEVRCQIAKELEAVGDYEGAREALGEFWRGLGERPAQIEVLNRATAAEVLLRIGTLTGWMGQAAQEKAKNLITEAGRIFESLPSQEKVLEAQTELAVCYWREGAYDEARDILTGAIERLTADSEVKAKAVLRSAIVERSAGRYNDALRILTDSAPLFEKVSNHTVRGSYHNELGVVLDNLTAAERREDYLDRAFVEYAAAGYHFEQAGHERYRANVENNLGFLYFKVGRHEEAHRHLDRARRILAGLKDGGTVAQVDETRARVFLAQGRHADAERAAGASVRTLERGDRQSLLAEALTTHGTALARLGRCEQARPALFRAVDVSQGVGAANTAGLAALAVIEELGGHMAADELQTVYQRAYRWLASSQDSQTLHRLLTAAGVVIGAQRPDERPEITGQGTLKDMVRGYEREIIKRALRKAGGSVTRASRLLGVSYQSLTHTIKGRHADLLLERKPAKKRRRSIIKKR